jgi:hypothetical protein
MTEPGLTMLQRDFLNSFFRLNQDFYLMIWSTRFRRPCTRGNWTWAPSGSRRSMGSRQSSRSSRPPRSKSRRPTLPWTISRRAARSPRRSGPATACDRNRAPENVPGGRRATPTGPHVVHGLQFPRLQQEGAVPRVVLRGEDGARRGVQMEDGHAQAVVQVVPRHDMQQCGDVIDAGRA